VDIEEDVARKVAAECAEFGVKSFGRKADVSKLEEIQALADAAYNEFGSVEILVNNAGVTLRPFRAHWETSPKDWNWIFSVNFFGVLNGHLAFVPRMIEPPGEKHIVNTSSAASLYDIVGHAAYSATMAACDTLSNNAREELKKEYRPRRYSAAVLDGRLPSHLTLVRDGSR
jgi:NAD(P)-dependent dehydrogenase (short-subunit alcohol dehydrogenase family)